MQGCRRNWTSSSSVRSQSGLRMVVDHGRDNRPGVPHRRGVGSRSGARPQSTCIRTGAGFCDRAQSSNPSAESPACLSSTCSSSSSAAKDAQSVQCRSDAQSVGSRLDQAEAVGRLAPAQSRGNRDSPILACHHADGSVRDRLCRGRARGSRARGCRIGASCSDPVGRPGPAVDVPPDATECRFAPEAGDQTLRPCAGGFVRRQRLGQRRRKQLRSQRMPGPGGVFTGSARSYQSCRLNSGQSAERARDSSQPRGWKLDEEVCREENSSSRTSTPFPVCLHDRRELEHRFRKPEHRTARGVHG